MGYFSIETSERERDARVARALAEPGKRHLPGPAEGGGRLHAHAREIERVAQDRHQRFRRPCMRRIGTDGEEDRLRGARPRTVVAQGKRRDPLQHTRHLADVDFNRAGVRGSRTPPGGV